MAGFRAVILIMQVSSGLLLAALSVPLIRGKIGPNPWYGFRVRRTLEDPAVWYRANAYSGKALAAAGIAMVVGSLALYPAPPLDDPGYATACAAIALGSLAVALIRSFRYLGRIDGPTDTRPTAPPGR